MVDGLPRVFALDRTRVRQQAVARFGVARMVREYAAVYQQVVEAHRADQPDNGSAWLGQTVLAVFAHPDDESLACGGTLARLADAGARVVLLCASRGERGSVAGPVRDDALGGIRSREFQRGRPRCWASPTVHPARSP